MILFCLWLFTSNYAVQVGTFPDAMSCAVAAVQMSESFNKPPRAFASRMACVPVIKALPAIPVPAPPAKGPSA